MINENSIINRETLIQRINEFISLVRSRSEIVTDITASAIDASKADSLNSINIVYPNINNMIDDNSIDVILGELMRVFSKIRKIKKNILYNGKLQSSTITEKYALNLTIATDTSISSKVSRLNDENKIIDNADIENKLNEIYSIWSNLPPIEIGIETCHSDCKSCHDNNVYHPCKSCKEGGDWRPCKGSQGGCKCKSSCNSCKAGETCRNGRSGCNSGNAACKSGRDCKGHNGAGNGYCHGNSGKTGNGKTGGGGKSGGGKSGGGKSGGGKGGKGK